MFNLTAHGGGLEGLRCQCEDEYEDEGTLKTWISCRLLCYTILRGEGTKTKQSILTFGPGVIHILSASAANPLVFVSASCKHRTGKIKQQVVYDRTALFGVRFDVSSHPVYGCFCPCFCFEIV